MIYLDHHAATPLVREARDAMDAARDVAWANPASPHAIGRKARALLEGARASVAASVEAAPSDVVFTAGGSEACQLGILGLARGMKRVVTTTIEHPAVCRSVEALAREGLEVVRVDVDERGPTEFASIAERIDSDTLVAVQWVNHEVGLVLPCDALALLVRARGGRLFVDATQAFGKLPITTAGLGADAIAVASHKMGGPSGAGAVILARGVALDPVLLGGGQERGRRAGSPSLESIVGFGAAAAVVDDRLGRMAHVESLRDALEAGARSLGGIVNARGHRRVATCLSVAFTGRRGSVLVAALDLEGVAVASGPACSSGLEQPSPTVLALTHGDLDRATGTLRFTLGPETTDSDGVLALGALQRVLERASTR